MTQIQHSVRLPLTLDKLLRDLAATNETSAYAILQDSVRLGLAQLAGEQNVPHLLLDIATEVGALSGRIVQIERLTERALYVACAAYVFARAAAGAKAEAPHLVEEIAQAFDRQLRLAGEQ